jgi:hypothetical protein
MIDLTNSPTQTESLAISLLADSPILGNSYFRSLKDGCMPKEKFIDSQVQFFYVVSFFSRHLAALTARFPGSSERWVLVHNLPEEHGLDEENPAEGFRPHLAQDKTFAAFLQSLGIDAEKLASNYLEPSSKPSI